MLVVRNITAGISDKEIENIADRVLLEADIDGDKRLSFLEFDHVITRTPDFIKYVQHSSGLAMH